MPSLIKVDVRRLLIPDSGILPSVIVLVVILLLSITGRSTGGC